MKYKDMAYKPGQSGNPAGRKPGSPNHTTAELRMYIHQFIMNNREAMQFDFNELEPKERLAFIEKLLKYILPRQTEPDTRAADLKQITGMEIY